MCQQKIHRSFRRKSRCKNSRSISTFNNYYGSIKDTVKALNEYPGRDKIKVMVGGAPITQEFADEIGADAYTEDAAV